MVTPRTTSWRTSIRAGQPARARDRAVRLPDETWRQLLADPPTVAAYHAKVYRRGSGECWFWLGAISEDGQAKFRVPRRMGERVVAAPVFGWQLSRGLLTPGPDGRLPVIRHTCDESACLDPRHWTLGTRKDNAADYTARKGDQLGPLADKRGPGGRAPAIRDAILRARKDGSDIEQAIRRAMDAGMPGIQKRMF